MCGIVGAIAQREVRPLLLEGLSRLEYRGYDSAGICTADEHGLHCTKTINKVQELRTRATDCHGTLGIAHTRWATHGPACERNAHPHLHGKLALVHNGIIENYKPLRERLINEGYQFSSDTDSEVLLCLIHSYHETGITLEQALRKALSEVEGSYAIALMAADDPGHLYGARHGSPLVIGLGIGENFLASDVLALLPVTHRFIYLEEDEFTMVSRSEVKIFTLDGTPVRREAATSTLDAESISRGSYRHFMQKEIFEQPAALRDTLLGRVSGGSVNASALTGLSAGELEKIEQVKLVACGTSYHAALVGRYWLEELTGLPASAEIASEYRYRKAVVRPGTLFVTISQSGETADTLASLRLAKTQGYAQTLCICNVNGSSLVRESGGALLTRAGVEIGVASTKAFTTQLECLLLLALALGQKRLGAARLNELIGDLKGLPELITEALAQNDEIAAAAAELCAREHTLYLGRGVMYPIALEGALKLKEISYIHAEGYAAGELKHGPIALIDEHMPVVAVAPDNALLGKLASNLEEVRARGGRLLVFAPAGSPASAEGTRLITMPPCPELLEPLVYVVPLQLLAYHCAVINGTDVDQPRNLAKSVTVE